MRLFERFHGCCFSLSVVALGGGLFGCGTSDGAPVGKPADKANGSGCNLKTAYPGDDSCLVAPASDVGMQFHYGPTDYSNPDEVNDFLLQPSEELVDCVYLKAPNEEKVYFSEFQNSLRPNSHHMIVSQVAVNVADGHRPCGAEFGTGDGGFMGAPRLVGGTSVARGRAGSAAAPEDEGLADYVDAHAQIEMQLHFINSTSKPVLREAWMNVYFMDPKDVKQVMEPIQGYGDVGWAIAPGSNETWRSSMTAPYHLRMVDIYSHYHVNTVRMTAWKVATTGERTKLYESYNWDEPGVLPLNTVTKNPAPDAAAKATGGISGILEFDQGDKVEWECEVENHRSVTLRYVNKALDGEMCNLRGNYAPSAGSQWIGFDLGHKCTGSADCPE